MIGRINEKYVLRRTPSFLSFAPDANACVYDDTEHDKYPSRMYTFANPDELVLDDALSSVYGYVSDGILRVIDIKTGRGRQVHKGEYFSTKEAIALSGNAVGIAIERVGEQVLNVFGGPIESKGRLKYIDGCSDTLLIPPVKKGMSCFNHLHFPSGITQTMHTHPSVRAGIVASGYGTCTTPFGGLPLVQNSPFAILPRDDRADGRHCFITSDSTMDVIAYHPDSDFGPTDENHPMINRTIVDGVSAAQIDSIRTEEI